MRAAAERELESVPFVRAPAAAATSTRAAARLLGSAVTAPSAAGFSAMDAAGNSEASGAAMPSARRASEGEAAASGARSRFAGAGLYAIGADRPPFSAGPLRLSAGSASCGTPETDAPATPETPDAAPWIAEETWDQAGSGAETRMREKETAAARNRFMGECYQLPPPCRRGPRAQRMVGKRPVGRWALGQGFFERQNISSRKPGIDAMQRTCFTSASAAR